MANLYCCHWLGEGGQVALFSWFLIKLWQFNIQCSTKQKYLKYFITIGESRIFRMKKNFTLWHEMVEFNEFSVLVHELNLPTAP